MSTVLAVPDVYNQNYFEKHCLGSLNSARVILPLVINPTGAKSIVDVGCGIGTWLNAANQLGISDLLGIDSNINGPESMVIPENNFRRQDLREPINLGRRFDLAICMEVAEHLPVERSKGLVSDLTKLSDVILFSAGIPYQGGEVHINEQWLEYWATLFRQHEYFPFDIIRRQVWNNPLVEPWYAQNALVFCTNEIGRRVFNRESDQELLSLVHPAIFLTNIARIRPNALRALKYEFDDYAALVRSNASLNKELPELSLQRQQTVDGRPLFPASRAEYADFDGTLVGFGRDHSDSFANGAKVTLINDEDMADILIGAQESSAANIEMRQEASTIKHEALNLKHVLRNTMLRHQSIFSQERKIADARQHVSGPGGQIKARVKRRLRNFPRREGILRNAAWKVRRRFAHKLLAGSALFDINYYLAHNSDVLEARVDPIDHFLQYGAAEGRNPHILFDINHYRSQVQLGLDENPLIHFLEKGCASRISPHPLFDPNFYHSCYPDFSKSGMCALEHYITAGWQEGRSPHPLFDPLFYLSQYTDVFTSGMSPLLHYLTFGDAENRNPHPLFRTSYYRSHYMDDQPAQANALAHFIKVGIHSGAVCHPLFKVISKKLAPGVGDNSSKLIFNFIDPVAAPGIDSEYHLARKLLALGIGNETYYGAKCIREPIEPGDGEPLDSDLKQLLCEVNDRDTRKVASDYEPDLSTTNEIYGPAIPRQLRDFAPTAEVERYMASRPLGTAARRPKPAGFTIVTPYHSHFEFFRLAAASVEKLLLAHPNAKAEWVIANDDPKTCSSDLFEAVPASIRSRTNIFSDGQNQGIVARLNQCIQAAQYDWILFLDCDDCIEPHTFSIIEQNIRKFPQCRYFSSCTIDINESGEILRYRRRTTPPTKLLAEGMTAGHLKAIRKDLFDEIGLLDQKWGGCQDYEFALRTAFHEPIVYLSDYLYSYRWHNKSQSVAKAESQLNLALQVVDEYCNRYLSLTPTSLGPSSYRHRIKNAPFEVKVIAEKSTGSATGAVIVRTQGERNEMLRDCLESIERQTSPCLPIVVLHGGERAIKGVLELCRDTCRQFILLHAEDMGRGRSYPLNMALKYLYEVRPSVDFVSFLDYDDIYYPNFAEKMVEGLRLSGNDVVCCGSNKRWISGKIESHMLPIPFCSLLIGNFIPINSYAISSARLLDPSAYILFSEQLDRLEDWHFLLQLFFEGFTFWSIGSRLCEVRLISDGSVENKQQPEIWDKAADFIKRFVALECLCIPREALYKEFFRFDYRNREPLSKGEELQLRWAKAFIESAARERLENHGLLVSDSFSTRLLRGTNVF